MGSSKTIVWFRRGFRIEDNPALAAAARDGCVFLYLYVGFFVVFYSILSNIHHYWYIY
jgi:deoxyribodipyrimidine photolyase